MSKSLDQSTLTSTVDGLLDSYDLDFLKEEYERNAIGLTIPFNECKRHYIQYLLAIIAADSFQAIDKTLNLSPPLHVDVLWHSHILETSRYREFEEIVLEAYRQSGRNTNLQHLDHSVVDNKVGREERIEKTKCFYLSLGFVFGSPLIDTRNLSDKIGTSKRELETSDQEDDSSSKKLKATNKTRDIVFHIEDGYTRVTLRGPSSARFEKAVNIYAARTGKKVHTLRFFNRQDLYSRISIYESLGQVFAHDEEGTEHIVMAMPELSGC